METLITAVLVIAFVVSLVAYFKALIDRKTAESANDLVEAISAHFKKLEEAYKTASVDEVNQRISFLEKLIESGFVQHRERIEKLEGDSRRLQDNATAATISESLRNRSHV